MDTPEFDEVPGVEASTGALGHGAPIGVGLAIGAKIQKKSLKLFVIVGDGRNKRSIVWEDQ